jgi:hypothetical protein
MSIGAFGFKRSDFRRIVSCAREAGIEFNQVSIQTKDGTRFTIGVGQVPEPRSNVVVVTDEET